ncbi:MAG: c-type cytochrome [Pirellulaceae bacterium]
MPGLGDSPVLNDERMASVLTYAARRAGKSRLGHHRTIAGRGGTASNFPADDALDGRRIARYATTSHQLDSRRQRWPERHRLLADGDATERGRILFHSNRALRCNACHIIGDQGGGFVGPNLPSRQTQRSRAPVGRVLPSAKNRSGLETFGCANLATATLFPGPWLPTTEKSSRSRPASRWQVGDAAADIEERIQPSVSSMPPVGETFTPQQIADLVAYLETLKADEAAADKAVVDEKPADAPFVAVPRRARE